MSRCENATTVQEKVILVDKSDFGRHSIESQQPEASLKQPPTKAARCWQNLHVAKSYEEHLFKKTTSKKYDLPPDGSVPHFFSCGSKRKKSPRMFASTANFCPTTFGRIFPDPTLSQPCHLLLSCHVSRVITWTWQVSTTVVPSSTRHREALACFNFRMTRTSFTNAGSHTPDEQRTNL